MSYRSSIESVPLVPDDWAPQDPGEIDINNERELAYWCNELRISIGRPDLAGAETRDVGRPHQGDGEMTAR